MTVFGVAVGRSQHGTERYLSWMLRFTRELGLAVVMQDVRGRGDSDGPNPWEAYEHEEHDGVDTVAWVAEQPWCNGSIGMFGYSYVGFTQTLAALGSHPALKALVPVASQQDNYGHWRVNGVLHWCVCSQVLTMAGRMGPPGNKLGALALFDTAQWERTLPLASAYAQVGVEMPFFSQVVAAEQWGAPYSDVSVRNRYAEIAAPALFITGWFDSLVHENFKLIRGFRKFGATEECRQCSKLVVGPWAHQQLVTSSGEVDLDDEGSVAGWVLSFGKQAVVNLLELHLQWYTARLLNTPLSHGAPNAIDTEAPISLFVMGANEWVSAHAWPLPSTEWHPCFLQLDGCLSWQPARTHDDTDQDTMSLSFVYNPRDPCPSVGAQFQAKYTAGPRDRSAMVAARNDVLVFETPRLETPLTIIGPVIAVLYVSSSCLDTDFTAALSIVTAQGGQQAAAALCEGICRVRFRKRVDPVSPGHGMPDQQLIADVCAESPEDENGVIIEGVSPATLMTAGHVYEITIDLWDTAIQLHKGEALRVDISSSNFPRYDRNLNTGGASGYETEAEAVIAENRVFATAQYQSRLLLPSQPSESLCKSGLFAPLSEHSKGSVQPKL